MRTSILGDTRRILVNYRKDPRDQELLRKGIPLARDLVEQPAFFDSKRAAIFPAPDTQSDENLAHSLSADTTQSHRPYERGQRQRGRG